MSMMYGIEWTGLRYPCNDPENGPARRNPVNGCRECHDREADSYDDTGLCCDCQEQLRYQRLKGRAEVLGALELDQMLAAAQRAGDKKEEERVRDMIFVRQKGIGFIDMEEQAGPEYSPAPGEKNKIKVSQDGGQFYNEETGEVMADYGDISDRDMESAIEFRKDFLSKFGDSVVMVGPGGEIL